MYFITTEFKFNTNPMWLKLHEGRSTQYILSTNECVYIYIYNYMYTLEIGENLFLLFQCG